jgi:hypothetical protein
MHDIVNQKKKYNAIQIYSDRFTSWTGLISFSGIILYVYESTMFLI